MLVAGSVGGTVGSATALMMSSSPQDYLDRATALDRISARGADRMRALRTASVRLAQAKASAREQAAAVRAINRTIAAKRHEVNALLAQAESMLSGLRADERARRPRQRRNRERAGEHDPRGGACPTWCELWPMCRVKRA